MRLDCRKIMDRGNKILAKCDHLSKWDWVLFALLAGFCFLSFAQGDIYLTGNRGWMLFESNFFNYYDVLEEWTQDHGANYMPTTFWLFAIWNLPLKLLGFANPDTVMTSKLVYVLWYKGLTTVFYLASAYLIFRIALILGMNARKAKVAMYSFLTMPVAFYSQFIFSQYDIFTVFFMLLGMCFYFTEQDGKRSSRNHVAFCLCFGVALTCKYYAILIFAILILLDEKRVNRLFASLFIMAIPFAVEYLIYSGSQGFQNGVFGFGALDYISQNDFATKIGGASFVKIFCVIIVIWSYFVTPKDWEDKVRWILYLCCGISFALFGLMTFHPQWLLFAVPFWVLSALISKHTEKFYWCNSVFIVVFHLFVFQYWKGAVDDVCLSNGVWKYLFSGRPMQLHAADVVPNIDHNTLYAIIIAVLLAYFVFAHPKFTREKLSDDDGKDHVWLIRLQLILTVVVFVVPCFYAAYMDISRVYVSQGEEQTSAAAIVKDTVIVQEVGGIDGELESINLFIYTFARVNTADVYVSIMEKDTGAELFRGDVNTQGIRDGSWNSVNVQGVLLSKEKVYLIQVGSTKGTTENCYAVAIGTNTDQYRGIYNGSAADWDVTLKLGFKIA